MKKRIFLEDNEWALKAEKLCFDEANRHGFLCWYDWWEHEYTTNPEPLVSEHPSYKFMISATNQIEKDILNYEK